MHQPDREHTLASRILVPVLILSLLLAGCQATKQDTGTVFGAALGAVAGSFFGNGAGKVLAIGIGAVLGGFIGNQIGSHLDEQDRKAVERQSAKALTQAKDGETSTWKNPDTKAEAEITVSKTETIQRDIPLVRSKEVEKPGKLVLIGEPFEILKDSNVRLGPSMNHDVAKVLKKGDVVLAVGKVKGKDWILINQDRHAIGYIYAPLAAAQHTAEAKQPIAADTNEDQTAMRPAHDLDAEQEQANMSSTLRPAIDLDTMAASYPDTPETSNYIAEKVEVEAPARTMSMRVTTPEGKEETTVTASKGTDGAWEIL